MPVTLTVMASYSPYIVGFRNKFKARVRSRVMARVLGLR